MTKKMGRPKALIDITQLKALMRLTPTLKDTAAFFDVDPRTVEKLIEKEYSLTFTEFREQNSVQTRMTLIRKAIHEATKERTNTAMLIFCLKNLCGWIDKPDQSIKVVQTAAGQAIEISQIKGPWDLKEIE